MRAEKSEMGRLEFVMRAAQTAAVSTGFASRAAPKDKSIGRADTITTRVLDRTQVRLPTLGYGALGRRNVFVGLLLWLRVTDAETSVGIEATKSRLVLLFRVARERRNRMIFAACCLFVAAVSVHDAMLVVLNANVISEVERNPVGRWLIEIQGGEVWLFVLLKLVGTAIVCAVFVTLYQYRARLALVASGGVAAFQMTLLWYLTFATQL